MSNRFDDMMVQGINTSDATATALDIIEGKTAYANGQKITGTLVPQGGSSEYNVYIQSEEPEDKNGVWFKSSQSISTDDVYFTPDFTKEGKFLGTNYPSLNQAAKIIGQVIVGDYLYVFGENATNSYRYNMKTKQKSSINVPTVTAQFTINAIYCPRNDTIYVFYCNSNSACSAYAYQRSTNTYTVVLTNEAFPITSSGMNSSLINLYDEIIYLYLPRCL